jgi:hypothetical protein
MYVPRMVYYGREPAPVRLDVDLTQYHEHLEVGVCGTLIPGLQVGVWGAQDRFGAVRFDCCGATLDILFKSLTILESADEAPGG